MSMIAPAIITMVPRTITIPANHPQIVSSNPLIGLLKFGEGAKYTDPGKCADSNLVTNTIMLCLSVCLLDESPFYTMQNSCVYLDHCRMLICPVDTPEQLVFPTRTRSSPRAAPCPAPTGLSAMSRARLSTRTPRSPIPTLFPETLAVLPTPTTASRPGQYEAG